MITAEFEKERDFLKKKYGLKERYVLICAAIEDVDEHGYFSCIEPMCVYDNIDNLQKAKDELFRHATEDSFEELEKYIGKRFFNTHVTNIFNDGSFHSTDSELYTKSKAAKIADFLYTFCNKHIEPNVIESRQIFDRCICASLIEFSETKKEDIVEGE